MTLAQKVLLGALGVELCALGILGGWHSRSTPLPEIDWKLTSIEEPIVVEIRRLEDRVRAIRSASSGGTGGTEAPDRAGAWLELALTYRAFGLYPEASYCFGVVERRAPRSRDYLYAWAECLDHLGEIEEATRRYRQVIDDPSIRPLGNLTVAYCWLNIGQDYLRREKLDEATDALRRAIDLPKAKYLLGRVLARTGRAAEAVEILDAALKVSPEIIEFNQLKGWAAADLNQTEIAQRHQEISLRSRSQLVRWDPVYREIQRRRSTMGSMAWYGQSLQLEGQGQFLEALDWGRKAVAADWTEEKAFQVAKLELQLGHTAAAIESMEESNRRVGASARALDLIGVGSFRLGDRAKALGAWELATAFEDTPNLRQKLAEMSRLNGDTRAAAGHLALEQYLEGKEAWLTNDLNRARTHFERSIQLADDYAPAWFYLGETRRAQGETGGAEAAYRRCLQLDPDHGRALRGLQRLGRAPSAIDP